MEEWIEAFKARYEADKVREEARKAFDEATDKAWDETRKTLVKADPEVFVEAEKAWEAWDEARKNAKFSAEK